MLSKSFPLYEALKRIETKSPTLGWSPVPAVTTSYLILSSKGALTMSANAVLAMRPNEDIAAVDFSTNFLNAFPFSCIDELVGNEIIMNVITITINAADIFPGI